MIVTKVSREQEFALSLWDAEAAAIVFELVPELISILSPLSCIEVPSELINIVADPPHHAPSLPAARIFWNLNGSTRDVSQLSYLTLSPNDLEIETPVSESLSQSVSRCHRAIIYFSPPLTPP